MKVPIVVDLKGNYLKIEKAWLSTTFSGTALRTIPSAKLALALNLHHHSLENNSAID